MTTTVKTAAFTNFCKGKLYNCKNNIVLHCHHVKYRTAISI